MSLSTTTYLPIAKMSDRPVEQLNARVRRG
jgi:hypothetical protein